jgi:hypothetical protein
VSVAEWNALDRWRALTASQRRTVLDALCRESNRHSRAAARPPKLGWRTDASRRRSERHMEKRRAFLAAATLLRAAGFLSLKRAKP